MICQNIHGPPLFCCSAATIPVHFDSALLEVTGPEPLPVLLSGSPNNLRLRFHVPDAASILSLNSLAVSVDLYNDDDRDNEWGELVFVLQQIGQPNLVFQSFVRGLNGKTESSPLTVTGSLGPGDLSNALASIQDDGFFLVRVNRNAGDFYVKSATATIDAETVPEPATFGIFGAAVAVGLIARRLRRFSSLRSGR